MDTRYKADDLRRFATELLRHAGLATDRAEVVAEVLIEGDLLGHTTHGLQMLVPYLKSIDTGQMTLEGDFEVVRDLGATVTLDGRYLPGPWLVMQAIELAEARIHEHGVVTVVIRRSHHIACLEAYLKRVTDRRHIALLMCSDPSVATVAPHGGLKPLYTPNPLAAGIPTADEPILMDISMSTTTNGRAMRLSKKGERLPHPWLKDSSGVPTDDPSVLFADPPGTILPLGGMDSGHKGFALGFLVEALTSALGGYGRADEPKHWGASVFLQVIDPAVFGGTEAFLRETTWFAEACRRIPAPTGAPAVRLPGESGLQKRKEQLAAGVELFPGILESLASWAERWRISLPTPIGGR